jgi:hypothetical protein
MYIKKILKRYIYKQSAIKVYPDFFTTTRVVRIIKEDSLIYCDLQAHLRV